MIRIVFGLAISVLAPVLAETPALAQDAAGKQQASLPPQEAKPEPRPDLIPGTVGQGPLTLVSSAAVTYQEYAAHACPLVLAVDAFGWTTYAALNASGECPKDVSQIPQQTMRDALEACEAQTHTPPCRIAAVGRKVVWDGPIRYLPGRFIPQDNQQASVILRKTVTEDMESVGHETAVGLITYGARGRTADIDFQRHDTLGRCRGSLTAPDGADSAPVMLTCTKTGALTGSVMLKAADGTGAGSVTGRGETFVLTVLPKADFMKNGTLIYAPPPKANAKADGKMPKQDKQGAS